MGSNSTGSSPAPTGGGNGRARSLRRRGSGPRRPPFFAILLLSGFLLLVLSFVTFRQLRSGEANRLRLLAGFAEQVEATVPELAARYVNTIDQTAALPETGNGENRPASPNQGVDATNDPVCSAGQQLVPVPHVELVSGPREPVAEPGLKLVPRGPTLLLDYHRRFDYDIVEKCREKVGLEGDTAITQLNGATPGAAERSAAPAEVVQNPPRRPARDETPEPFVARYAGRLDLSAVIDPLVIPDVFDLVVIAKQPDFEVLFQSGNRELKMDRVSASWEVETRDLLRSIAERIEKEPPTPPSGSGTRIVEVEIAGTDFRVFLQPVTLHLRDAKDNPLGTERWIACGLISWDRLLASSFTTSPVLLFLMVAVFPVLLAAWPFLKLGLISRNQRFTRFDVAALLLACVLAVALGTVLLLDFVFMTRLQRTVDGQLEQLAAALERSFREEVADGTRQIEILLRNLDPVIARRFAGDRRLGVDPAAEGDFWRAVAADLPEAWRRDRVAGRPRLVYPILHSIFWTDARGEQAYKIPFREDALLRNNVGDRRYFQCARGRGAQDLRIATVHDLPRQARPTCLESIRSKTTAEDLAALSVATGDDEHPVLVIVTRFASLSHAHLGPGFAFTIVDREGQVQFHSDRRRNASEDFRKAAEDDRLLAAMIRERRTGSLAINYWGQRHRAFVQPVEGTSWSMVTLRSARDLRARNFELLLDFLNPFLPFLVAACLGLVLAIRYLPLRLIRFLWPSRAYTPLYRAAIFAGPFVVCFFLVALVFDGPNSIFARTLLAPILPVLAMAVGAVHLESAPADEDLVTGLRRIHGSWRELDPWERLLAVPVVGSALLAVMHDAPTARLLALVIAVGAVGYVLLRRSFVDRTSTAPYVGAFATLLFCSAVLPSIGLFELAQWRQTHLLVQDTQIGLVRTERQYQDALEAERPPMADEIDGYDDYFRRFVTRVRATHAKSLFDSRVVRPAEAPSRIEPTPWPYAPVPTKRKDLPRPAANALSQVLSIRPVPLTDLAPEPEGTDLSRFGRPEGSWWISRAVQPPRLVGRLLPEQEIAGPIGVSSLAEPNDLLADLPPLRGLLISLAWAVLLIATVGIAAFVAKRVLLVDLAPNRRHATLEKIVDRLRSARSPQRVLLVFSIPEAVERVAKARIDADDGRLGSLAILPFSSLWSSETHPAKRERLFLAHLRKARRSVDASAPLPALLVTDFQPETRDPKAAKEQIDLLETLRRQGGEPGRSILIVTSSVSMLVEPSEDEWAREDARSREAVAHWAGYLARFTQRYGRDAGKPNLFRSLVRRLGDEVREKRWVDLHPVGTDWFAGEDLPAKNLSAFRAEGPTLPLAEPAKRRILRLLEVVEDECRWSWRLQRIGLELIAEFRDEIAASEFGDRTSGLPTHSQLVSRIEFSSLQYYQKIWNACDPSEKRVLHQLAREGMVNPKSFDIVLDLLNKGLVVREARKPALRVMNQSFANFIVRTAARSEVVRWEDEEGFSAWEVWKWVLPLPLLLLGVFLFITQQDAVSNIVGLLIALASLVPTGFNLYQHFQQVTAEREAGVGS